MIVTYGTELLIQQVDLIQILYNALGCDSIHILNLTINQSDTSYSNITACDSAIRNGLTYTNTELIVQMLVQIIIIQLILMVTIIFNFHPLHYLRE